MKKSKKPLRGRCDWCGNSIFGLRHMHILVAKCPPGMTLPPDGTHLPLTLPDGKAVSAAIINRGRALRHAGEARDFGWQIQLMACGHRCFYALATGLRALGCGCLGEMGAKRVPGLFKETFDQAALAAPCGLCGAAIPRGAGYLMGIKRPEGWQPHLDRRFSHFKLPSGQIYTLLLVTIDSHFWLEGKDCALRICTPACLERFLRGAQGMKVGDEEGDWNDEACAWCGHLPSADNPMFEAGVTAHPPVPVNNHWRMPLHCGKVLRGRVTHPDHGADLVFKICQRCRPTFEEAMEEHNAHTDPEEEVDARGA